jgi:putative hydrolase of the HAD superfamily
MTTIKAILFDFGQVLNAAQDQALVDAHRARLAARLAMTGEELWPYLFEGELGQRLMAGELAREEYWRTILGQRGLVDPAEVRAFADSVFAVTDELHPDMVALLAELKPHYLLGVVSNATWPDEEMERMFREDYGLPADRFDAVVTSTSTGYAKPHPRIFQEALQRLGVEPAEAVFTDDLPSFTAAAASLGLHAHTFTTPAAFRAFLRELGVWPIAGAR